jgi:hypothetical protein
MADKNDKPKKSNAFELIAEEPKNIQNDFGQAIGFSNPFGFQSGIPGQGGFSGGTYQQVEDSGTMWNGLRWYLVSNFRQLLSQAYVEMGLVRTIVDVPVDDGLRGGVLIKSKQLDESQIKELHLSMDRDDDLGVAGYAGKWERLYGGAGIIVLVNDQDPEEPFDITSVKENTELEFRAVDMWELFWDKQNLEGFNAEGLQTQDNFEFYKYYSENLHKTRVMRLKGLTAPSFVRPRLRGWGFSVVESLVRSMNQYLKATDLSFQVLDEFKLDVYKIKNLVNTLLSSNGTSKVMQTVQMLNWQKNYQNAIVMDSEDDFDHKQLSFAGLADAMAEIRMQVAADMRMPITKLFGTSVSKGFATDENDMENYNSMVESEVRGKLKYHILRMLEIKCQKMFGMIPDDLEIEFKPLRELSAVDQETVKAAKFDRLDRAIGAGRITDLEFRDACNKGNLFDVQLDTTASALNDPDLGVNQEDEEEETPGAEKPDKEDPKKVKKNNSADFDKASYEADGGDAWIDPKRQALFEDPRNVDKGLWSRAKDASQKAFGKDKWQFVTWWYKKQGGKFS